MKLGTTILALSVLSLSALSGAQKMQTKHMGTMSTATKISAKTDWKGMYKMAERAFEKKDVNAITMWMTPDFKMTSMGMTWNLTDSKKHMTEWFKMMKNLDASINIVKINEKGDMAVVTDKFKMSGMMMDPKTKKMHKFENMGTETAHWVRKNGKWMMKSMDSKDEKMMLDGKPFKPNMK